MIRKTTRQFEKEIADNAKTSPKRFWAHIRRRLKTKSGIAPLLDNIGTKKCLKFSDKDKANISQVFLLKSKTILYRLWELLPTTMSLTSQSANFRIS